MFWRNRYKPRHLEPSQKTPSAPPEPQLGPATAYPNRAGAYALPHNQGEWQPVPPVVGHDLPGHRCRNERK